MRWAALAGLLAACAGDGDDGGDRCGTTRCAPGSLIWAGQAGSATRVRVTAVATSPGEPPWFAGTFADVLEFDGVLTYRAANDEDDVFVARIGARATVSPWVVLARTSSEMRVAGVLPDQEEGALLITEGALPDDAGWGVGAVAVAHDTYEVVDDPVPLVQLAAPAASGVTAVTGVDGAGWPLVAISGQFEGERRGVLRRLRQGLIADTLFDVAGVEITDVALAAADSIAIGGRYRGEPPGWPACPESEGTCGFAATVDAHHVAPGEARPPLRSLFVFRAAGGAEVLAVGGFADGNVAALCRVAGATVEPSFPDPQPTLYLAFSEGDFVGARALSASPNLALAGAALDASTDGAVVALSFLDGAIFVDGDADEVSSDASGTHDLVIAEYPRAGDGAGWHLLVRTDGTADVSALAVEDDQVAVGGNYTGQLSIASGTVLTRTPEGIGGPVSQGFVLELVR